MINETGNGQIDQATAEIAVAVRDAHLGALHDQYYYDVAMDLRDAIMAGTRELDAPEPPLDIRVAGDRERVLAEADEAVRQIQERAARDDMTRFLVGPRYMDDDGHQAW